MTRVCVLGLGEAGAAIAADLAAAGVEVHGYDPAHVATPPGDERPDEPTDVGTPAGPTHDGDPSTTTPARRAGSPAQVVRRHDDPRAAVAGADVILAITPAAQARSALDQVLDAVPTHAIYADLSTASAGLKQQLATVAGRAGLGFVDVALMSPVLSRGLRTSAVASGPAADAFVAIMGPLGMPVENAGDEAGRAATRKLLRSVVMKGLAQLIIESLQAAEAAGVASETWENLVAQLTSIDEPLVRRLVTGTGLHAPRRLDEMEATVELLTELGVEPVMSRATTARLRHLADNPSDLPAPPDD